MNLFFSFVVFPSYKLDHLRDISLCESDSRVIICSVEYFSNELLLE